VERKSNLRGIIGDPLGCEAVSGNAGLNKRAGATPVAQRDRQWGRSRPFCDPVDDLPLGFRALNGLSVISLTWAVAANRKENRKENRIRLDLAVIGKV
jgi:hypothetical protein